LAVETSNFPTLDGNKQNGNSRPIATPEDRLEHRVVTGATKRQRLHEGGDAMVYIPFQNANVTTFDEVGELQKTTTTMTDFLVMKAQMVVTIYSVFETQLFLSLSCPL
jgi:hypothetical protein